MLVGAGDHCKRADSFVGSPYYVAPDVLRHSKYCNKVDWWSFGVLLYRMLAGFNPFGGHNLRQVCPRCSASLSYSVTSHPAIQRSAWEPGYCLVWRTPFPGVGVGGGGGGAAISELSS